MKIIFDRSAFHGEDFDLLKSSRLSELVREREVLVFHTMVLLEETLRMIERHGNELKRQWPFLRSICNAGWFKPLLLAQPPELKSVCEEELDGDNKDDNWPVVPSKHRSVVEAQLDNIIAGTASLSEVDNAKEKWDQNHRAKDSNKKLLRHFRERPFIRKGQSFAEYYQVSRDANASILSGQLASSRPRFKFDFWNLNVWRSNTNQFPHFAAFVELYTYAEYDAQKNRNAKLDSNWLQDSDQLSFLVDVDMIVSSDKNFMKRAFNELWKPRGKRMFTPEEFVEALNRI